MNKQVVSNESRIQSLYYIPFTYAATVAFKTQFPMTTMHNLPAVYPFHQTPGRLNLIEYGDYTCTACRTFQHVLTTILPLFNEAAIHYTFRHFPDLSQPSSLLLARAAEAARRQNRYWSMHQALFTLPLPVSIPDILTLAQGVGMDTDQFMLDFQGDTIREDIWADIKKGRSSGVETTPTLFMNTRLVHGKLTQARVVPLLRNYVSQFQKRPLVSEVHQYGPTR